MTETQIHGTVRPWLLEVSTITPCPILPQPSTLSFRKPSWALLFTAWPLGKPSTFS